MTHVLVATLDKNIRAMIEELLTLEGYWTTGVEDGWQMLAALRATLHPMLVIFQNTLVDWQLDPEREEPWRVMLRQVDDLRHHRWLALYSGVPAPMGPIYDELDIELLAMPFSLDDVLHHVAVLAAELPAR